ARVGVLAAGLANSGHSDGLAAAVCGESRTARIRLEQRRAQSGIGRCVRCRWKSDDADDGRCVAWGVRRADPRLGPRAPGVGPLGPDRVRSMRPAYVRVRQGRRCAIDVSGLPPWSALDAWVET